MNVKIHQKASNSDWNGNGYVGEIFKCDFNLEDEESFTIRVNDNNLFGGFDVFKIVLDEDFLKVFKKEKIVVKCETYIDAMEFIDWCTKSGIKTSDNNIDYYKYKENSCYGFHSDHLGFGTEDSGYRGYEIINYRNLIKIEEEKIMKYKLGDTVKIIDAGSGALGCNGRVGKITDEKMICGCIESSYKVKTENGSVWGLNKVCKLELINKFSIGDVVEVIDCGETYSTFERMAVKLGATKWSSWESSSNGLKGKVINYDDDIYLVDFGNREYLIGEHGLKKVEETMESYTIIKPFNIQDIMAANPCNSGGEVWDLCKEYEDRNFNYNTKIRDWGTFKSFKTLMKYKSWFIQEGFIKENKKRKISYGNTFNNGKFRLYQVGNGILKIFSEGVYNRYADVKLNNSMTIDDVRELMNDDTFTLDEKC